MLITVISILQLIFGITIAFLQNLFSDEPEKNIDSDKGRHAKRVRNICTVVLLISMVILSFFKDQLNESAVAEINRQDSIRFEKAQIEHKTELKNTAKELQDQFTKSLALYGLEYKRLHDSSGKIIEKLLKDSVKRTIIEESSPHFGFSIPAFIAKRNGDTVRYNLNLFNQGAPSIIKQLSIYIAILDANNQYKYLHKFEFSKKPRLLFKDYHFSQSGTLAEYNLHKAKWIYFYLKGNYSDSKNKYTYSIDELYGARLGDSTVGSFMNDPFRSEIIEAIESHKIGD